MTGSELAALPVGSLVKHDGDLGEVVRSGLTTHILFPGVGTILVDTESKVWQDDVISQLEIEE